MKTKIFVNLPVRDLPTSKTFFSKLGFEFNEQFTNDHGGCLVISDTIYVMLLTLENFRQFTKKEIIDPSKSVQAIIAISAETRNGVDKLTNAALNAGGRQAGDLKDYGFMYGKSFEDPDGHIWEVLWIDETASEGK